MSRDFTADRRREEKGNPTMTDTDTEMSHQPVDGCPGCPGCDGTSYRREHRQVQASRALIDEDLAPLIGLLWAADIDTMACCQGGKPHHRDPAGPPRDDDEDSHAWISFQTARDTAAFIEGALHHFSSSDVCLIIQSNGYPNYCPNDYDADDEDAYNPYDDDGGDNVVLWHPADTAALTDGWRCWTVQRAIPSAQLELPITTAGMRVLAAQAKLCEATTALLTERNQ
jgi:hypothetical protein